jgi:ABC-2 type transport system ATP-binding protein
LPNNPVDPLVISALKKNYGTINAVKGISFKVKAGEIYGLIGPDGAGKTTTMRMIVSLLKPDAGEILFQGRPVGQSASFVRASVGYMPQRFSLYPDLTVEQNLHFFGDLFGISRQEQAPRIERLYRFSRLEPFKTRAAGALSGGMKQKLALCCVLIHEPEVLVLDEPTVGVDPVSRNEFWQILHALQEQGTAILLSTAYMDEAAQCGRVGLMYDGTLLADDEPQRLIEAFPYPVYHLKTDAPYETFERLQNTELKDCIQLFGSGVHICDGKNYGVQALKRKLEDLHIETGAMTKSVPQLEDVFLELMGKKST